MSKLPDRTIKGMFAQARQIAHASRTHTAEALDRLADEQEQTRLSLARGGRGLLDALRGVMERDERDEGEDDEDDQQRLLDRLDDIIWRE